MTITTHYPDTLAEILAVPDPTDMREALRGFLYRAEPIVGEAPAETLFELVRDASARCLTCGGLLGPWIDGLVHPTCEKRPTHCKDCDETFPADECVSCQYCGDDICTWCRVRCAAGHDGCRACHSETCTSRECES